MLAVVRILFGVARTELVPSNSRLIDLRKRSDLTWNSWANNPLTTPHPCVRKIRSEENEMKAQSRTPICHHSIFKEQHRLNRFYS